MLIHESLRKVSFTSPTKGDMKVNYILRRILRETRMQTITPHTLDDWINDVNDLISQGQFFLAQDYAHAALELFPESPQLIKLKTRALLEAGAIDEARKVIEPFASQSIIDKDLLEETFKRAAKIFTPLNKAKDPKISWGNLKEFAEISWDMHKIAEMMKNTMNVDEEALSLLTRIYKQVWQRQPTKQNFEKAYKTAQNQLHQHESAHAVYNASLFTYINGQKAAAANLADTFLRQLSGETPLSFLYALIALVAGDKTKAGKILKESLQFDRSHHTLHVIRRELNLMESYGIKSTPTIKNMVKPPVIVAFTGHMIDAISRTKPRFPPQAEPYVKEAMRDQLEEIDAKIGYASAASGGDLIFLETLLERGAEINIVLPFGIPDFIDVSVGGAGTAWVTRFRHAMKLAQSVTFATEEPYLGDDILFQFMGLMVFGQSLLRAKTLEAEPNLIALWDKTDSKLVGGTSDIVARWQNKDTLHIIDMNKLRELAPKKASLPHEPAPLESPDHVKSKKERVVKTLLFADVVGFSKLSEHHVPGFIAFMQYVAENISLKADKPLFLNTWGDAIFAILDDATSMAKYALALKAALLDAGQKDFGLPTQLSLRIGLHVGPVYSGTDPITDRLNFYGSHVNRAARIEPVTIPGRVYASEQFVSLLAAEEAGQLVEAKKKKITFPWIYEYVGTMALAKKFGAQRIYHLTERLS